MTECETYLFIENMFGNEVELKTFQTKIFAVNIFKMFQMFQMLACHTL